MSKAVLRFARVLIRNYYVITTLFPQEMKMEFRPHDKNAFPPFRPPMSPSQKFQFTYNAYCSYYQCTYFHEVVQFFHSLVISGNGVADLAHLPLEIIEVNSGDSLDLQALFMALVHYKLISGIVCNNIARPDIAYNIAPLIQGNNEIRIVDLSNCRIEKGILELANAVIDNPRCNVVYWDLSENRNVTFLPFCMCLGQTRANVFYINLSNCKLTFEDLNGLLQSLIDNSCLHSLRHLFIDGATFNKTSIVLFKELLVLLKDERKLQLKTLSISSIGSAIEPMILLINSYSIPLEKLNISHNKIKEKVVPKLIQYVSKTKTLKELNISKTDIRSDDIVKIIEAISNNENLDYFALNLSLLGLNSKRLVKILNALKRKSEKWCKLSFDENGMSSSDLTELINVCKSFQNLISISLSGNFNSKSKTIESVLPQLLEIESLEQLCIKGTPKNKLGNNLFKLFNALTENQKIQVLDVSSNRIGDIGLKKLTELISKNTNNICEIEADGSGATYEAILSFLDALSNSEKIHSCKFPIEDVYNILGSVSSTTQRKKLYEKFSSKQIESQKAIEKNKAAVGIHSDLSKKGIPELNELLDEITLSMSQKLNGVKVNEHAGLASAFGLTMPHLNEGETQETNVVTNNVNYDKGYDLENSNVTIIEELNNNNEEDGLRTLQFNSLCIRRPATTRNQRNAIIREEEQNTQQVMMSGSLLPPNEKSEKESSSESKSESEADSGSYESNSSESDSD
ncbi:Leucine Rich Repeat family protein [Histomonas meleagridis]|uniref:Leucine Rich Repeat family protein n=1 Tax=Histomonas meleagridis TaxID=135588 RepID=UPI00355AA0A6|nr:Leucine Rich Repeat family protein [Histomonas meleagridis]KAH0803161.1 Leucine Rich Repeat family protein [Histomonas meleagridis]